jgi:hypothetical protein
LERDCRRIIFKLEEETPALLLLLLYVFAETAVLVSALRTGCWLVVGDAQAVQSLAMCSYENFKLEDNNPCPPLIIFYQRRLQHRRFWRLRMKWVADWLRRFLQAEQTKQHITTEQSRNRLNLVNEIV